MVGAVFHVVRDDNTGECDPYYIERIKNCMTMMSAVQMSDKDGLLHSGRCQQRRGVMTRGWKPTKGHPKQ